MPISESNKQNIKKVLKKEFVKYLYETFIDIDFILEAVLSCYIERHSDVGGNPVQSILASFIQTRIAGFEDFMQSADSELELLRTYLEFINEGQFSAAEDDDEEIQALRLRFTEQINNKNTEIGVDSESKIAKIVKNLLVELYIQLKLEQDDQLEKAENIKYIQRIQLVISYLQDVIYGNNLSLSVSRFSYTTNDHRQRAIGFIDGNTGCFLYQGNFQNRNFHGKGKITFANGDIYEGDFVDGHFTGKGKMIFINGEIYEGDFVNEKLTGRGRYTFLDGDIYEGDFIEGERTGKGKYTFANGNVYEGDFIDGVFDGKGKITFANGEVYEGDFIDGIPNGKGKVSFANGNVYEGDFVDEKLAGKGKYTFANGNVYEGDFVDGRFTGKGKSTFVNGDIYEGDFMNGKINGKGRYTFANGNVYEGSFINGFSGGKGKVTFANGFFYETSLVDYKSPRFKYIVAKNERGDSIIFSPLGQDKRSFRINKDGYIGYYSDSSVPGSFIYNKSAAQAFLGELKKSLQGNEELDRALSFVEAYSKNFGSNIMSRF